MAASLMRGYAILLLACTIAGAQDFEREWQGDRLAIRVRAGAVGNLAWQLDTLAGHTNTRPKDYEQLWRNDLAWSPADAAQLDRWSRLHRRYRREVEGSSGGKTAYPRNYARLDPGKPGRDYSFRIVALGASDLAAARRGYEALCGRGCAAEITSVLEHFLPRFSTWWQREGLPTASRMIPEIVDQASRYGLGKLPESSIRLARSQVGEHHRLGLDIVVHPKKYLSNFTATVLDDHILMEVVDDPKIGGVRLPLVIHEFTHHFYELAPREEHARLIRRFLERPEPYSMAAYSVLNEAVASAVQMLAEKRMRSDEDFRKFLSDDGNVYFDPFIAKAGRAATAVVEQLLAKGGTIFDEEFVDAYLRGAAAELGPLALSPRFLVSSRAQIHWASGKEASDEFSREVRGIATFDRWQDLKDSAELSGVVFVTQAEIGRLGSNRGVLPRAAVDAVAAAAREHPAFAYAWRRSPKAMVYVLYGRDAKRLLAVTRGFAGSDQPFTGLRAEIPGGQ